MQRIPKRLLLTGGAGFIGSHLAEALLDVGVELTIVDNLNDFYSPQEKEAILRELRRRGDFQLFVADITDMASMSAIFALCQPEAVVHLAAYAGVRPSLEKPHLYNRVNVAGTLNLLEASRKSGVQRFIFGSSSSVYGACTNAPFSEDESLLRPVSPYAATKLAGEMLGHTYSHLYQMPVICLRFFTVYGPRQRPDLAIRKFTTLIEQDLPVPVFGDGNTGRDYTHVSDIVNGIISALLFKPDPTLPAPFEIFNLGNSHPVRLSELIETLESALGKRATQMRLPMEPGDVPLTWADISKARRLLGYQPRVQLADGLSDFVLWYRRCHSSVESFVAA